MNDNELLSVIDELNNKYFDVWKKICNIESPTCCKLGVDAVGELFIEMAKEQGWDIEISKQEVSGNPICITMNPDAKGEPVIFSGHIDTVHPIGLFNAPVVRCDDNKIYGPGVMDCKGGVVASFMAMEALQKCHFIKRPVKLIIQTDEETGSRTSGLNTVKFMQEKSKGAIAFLNTEGIQGNTAVLVRKGILQYEFTIHGKAMHSANCNNGANAITEAAHKIIELEKLKDVETLTCNCGIIHGGTVPNAVAAECSFVADFRFASKQDCDMAHKIAKEESLKTTVEGCKCTIKQISFRPAMPLCQRNTELLEKANEIYKKIGIPTLTARTCASGSDAAYITEIGIPCIDNLGVDGGKIHSVEEFAYINTLSASAKRLAAVAFNI